MPTFSIVTCSYNGATRLPDMIRHLAGLKTQPELRWEWLLIPNACTDDTADIAIKSWEQYQPDAAFFVFPVDTPGKSFALSHAVEKARGKYIIICDDDNWLPPDYLQLAYEIMESHPDYGILGGRAEAVAESAIPEWFYEVQYAYACGSPCSVSIDLTGKGMLWGAGMVIRQTVAAVILHKNYPTLLTGRRLGLLTAGEDDEKCVRVWLTGYKTYYDYRLHLCHFMPHYRLTMEFKEKLLNGFVEQGPVIAAYKRRFYLENDQKKVLFLVKQMGALLLARLTANKEGVRIAQDYIYFLTRWTWARTNINQSVESFANFAKQAIEKDAVI